MRLLPFTIKGAFLLGALTTGAFISGTALGLVANKKQILSKLKKSQFKKNKSASS